MNPQAIPAVADQSSLTQMCEMSGNVRLGGTGGMGEFANAEFVIPFKQKKAAQSSRIC